MEVKVQMINNKGAKMKKLILTMAIYFLLTSVVGAYTTTTPLTFEKDVPKIVVIEPPTGAASCNGKIATSSNIAINSLTTVDPNKEIAN